jgi:lysophospholipase L1-like esterase
MKRILFQGDSITDCGRSREVLTDVGNGYPYLVRAHYGLEKPGQFEIVNRGISGNRSVDVYARIKADIINLKPDYMSILMGVNDVWHELAIQNGVATPKFEKIYTMLIEEVLEALPNIKLMILEPYALPGSATEGTLEDGADKYTVFRKDTEDKAAACRRVAEKFNIPFVPLQAKLDAMANAYGTESVSGDGVHPNVTGHLLIARAWMEAFEKNYL